jgi:hypothetical protein
MQLEFREVNTMLSQSIFFNDLDMYDLDLLVDLAGEAAEDDQPISIFFIRQWMRSTDPKIASVGEAAFVLLLGQDALRLIGALSARQTILEGLRAEARDKHESDNLKERIMRVNRLTLKAHKRYVRRFERYHDNVQDDV